MPGQYSFPFSALLVYKLLAKIDHPEAKITSAEVVIRVAKPLIVRMMHTFALGAATSDDRPKYQLISIKTPLQSEKDMTIYPHQ